jgi:hypothetical protein
LHVRVRVPHKPQTSVSDAPASHGDPSPHASPWHAFVSNEQSMAHASDPPSKPNVAHD